MKSEDLIQQEIVMWVRNVHRKGIIAHIPNQNQQHLVKIGVLPGFPDLIYLIEGGITILFEVKRPGETLSPKQKALHPRITALGHLVFTVYSLEDAQQILNQF